MFGRFSKILKALALVLTLAIFSTVSSAMAIPQNHEQLYDSSLAYKTMYERFDTGLMRAYNILEEDIYKQLEKLNEDFIAQYVQDEVKAGKAKDIAYAEAYAQCILGMEALTTKAFIAASAGTPAPQTGFYQLLTDNKVAYLSIIGDDENGYEIEVAVWEKNAPETFAWVHARASKIGERFFTDSVENPMTGERNEEPHAQICIDINDGKAEVTTTKRFQDGGFMYFNFGEDITIKPMIIDGLYILEQ